MGPPQVSPESSPESLPQQPPSLSNACHDHTLSSLQAPFAPTSSGQTT